ncbi:MAG: alpha-galactosidase [Verrucomicrobia bacterium]|nr:alpha-galactosidase [Verrucomicrobiota bacterium]
MKNKATISAVSGFVALLLGCATSSLSAATHSIANATLAVRYDDVTQTFSVTENAMGQTFLIGGKLEGEAVKAAVKGRTILVTQADGSTASLELRENVPFVFARKTLRNAGATTTDIQRVVPLTFTIDLRKPATELRTMGTAGLTAPDAHPGSYVFLTLADPATRRGVVAGWLTHDRGDGVLFSNIKDGKVEFKAQIDYGHLRIPPGKSETLETLVIGVFDDARIGQELFADAMKEHYHIKLRPQPAGFCTWYSEVGGLTDQAGGAGACNEKDLTTLTEFAARELKPFGFGFVQIDDEWQDGATNPDGSRINGPRRGFTRHKPNGGYPNGMAPVAAMIRQHGLLAGLWFMPFARNHQDPEYKDRQDWFMKRLDGEPYETKWGGTSLDLTHPKVQAHLAELARTLRGWGFNYFKLDGLWTASVTEQIYVNDGYKDDHIGNHQPFHDPDVTNIEALRTGLKLLRKAAGPDVFFSGCNVSQNMRSLGGAIGLVDSMRIGPDNGFGWQDYRSEAMHNEGGGIITGPIRGNRLYFLHGRVWWNDPDPVYVRPVVKLNHARLLASWVAVSGMFNLMSDWLPGLPPERLDILKRCLPSHRATAQPVDYLESPMPAIWLTTDTSQRVRRDVLGLYNWDSAPKAIGYDAAKAGLDGGATYHAFDFWSEQALPEFKGAFRFDVPAESCRVIALRKAEGHPALVSTSRHVMQGMVDVTGERWNDRSSSLSAVSQLVAKDPCELRIAGLAAGGKRLKPVAVELSRRDRAAGVTATLLPGRNEKHGWCRVTLVSPASRAVRWIVRFEP